MTTKRFRNPRLRRAAVWVILASALPLLTACSTKFRMPWDDDPLDPSNIVVREPLQMPPDLWVLPQPGEEEEEKVRVDVQKTEKYDTAGTILFGQPKAVDLPDLGRDASESLPEWMGGTPPASGK